MFLNLLKEAIPDLFAEYVVVFISDGGKGLTDGMPNFFCVDTLTDTLHIVRGILKRMYTTLYTGTMTRRSISAYYTWHLGENVYRTRFWTERELFPVIKNLVLKLHQKRIFFSSNIINIKGNDNLYLFTTGHE